MPLLAKPVHRDVPLNPDGTPAYTRAEVSASGKPATGGQYASSGPGLLGKNPAAFLATGGLFGGSDATRFMSGGASSLFSGDSVGDKAANLATGGIYGLGKSLFGSKPKTIWSAQEDRLGARQYTAPAAKDATAAEGSLFGASNFISPTGY